MERQTPIMDALYDISGSSKARFCMPGHKGDSGYFGGEMLKYDITELPGADNLLKPSGAIKKSQDLHANFIRAGAAYYTTGGSTAGVLAMLSLYRGKKVIFPRGIHISAANAIRMFEIKPVFLASQPCDYPFVVSAADIKAALSTNRDAAAVFIVYPSYYGICCDIQSIAQIAHKAKVPLLVDAAHSAHFVYSSLLPMSPSDAGADIWTQSAHKTLPAINGCACVCAGESSLVPKREVKRALGQIQSTSPSYLLLGSLDYANAYMRDKGEQELYRIITLCEQYEKLIDELDGFSCPKISMTGMTDKDRTKMIIDVSKSGHTGLAIKDMLAKQGIHIECADAKTLLVLLTVGDTKAHLEMLYRALSNIEKIRGKNIYFSPHSLPEATKYSQNSRYWEKTEKVRIERSVKRISASTAGVFPPGEVVIMRGQVISFEIAGYLLEAKRQGFDIFGIEDDSIYVFEEI